MWIYVVTSFFLNFANANPFYYECQNVVTVQNEDLGQARTDSYVLCLKTLKTQGVKGFDLHVRCQSSNLKCWVRVYQPVDLYSCDILAKTLQINPGLLVDEAIKNSCPK